MSINNSYFSRNNTIVYGNYVNTGRNPVTELFFGFEKDLLSSPGFSRFIFNINKDLLFEKVNQGIISFNCSDDIKHRLCLKNTCSFDKELLNEINTSGRRRATSFDLFLFRIPQKNSIQEQNWDEGVGYDYTNSTKTINTSNSNQISKGISTDKSYSDRPSNWFQTTTLDFWEEPGIYNNKNKGEFNYSALTIIDTQHFEFGDEDINFDMTDEINGIINGSIDDGVGYGIAFVPDVENISGLTENYSVAFFTRHTQTFYEPYLQTTYDDLIEDDRNYFTELKENKIYLYVYQNGEFFNLDENPVVDILDYNGTIIPNLSNMVSCRRTKGVYEITVPPISGFKTPCQFFDVWKNLKFNNESLPVIQNEFVLLPVSKSIQIGVESKDPETYGFDYYGIKQDEKILNTDIRKVGVIIKKAFTTQKLLKPIDAYYRVYVKEGQTEVQVQDWTKINRTTNEYYFLFDTRDKIPNEYFIDIKVTSSGEVNTYKRQIKFQIVNIK
jgi:hypothetical protein